MKIELPRRSVTMHRTPMDLAEGRIISRMYGQYNVREGWMYPASPYGGNSMRRALGNLGATWNPPTRGDFGLDPGGGGMHCSPRDSACVADQNSASNAYVLAMDRYQAQYNYESCMEGGDPNRCAGQYAIQIAPENPVPTAYVPPTFTPPVYVPPPPPVYSAPPSYAGTYRPQVSFTTSTGNTGQLKPGDSWVITITGAQPGAAISVTGGQNGQNITTPMGTADGSGNWRATGSIDTSQIGNWSERWTAGGADAGSFSFTVVAATSQQQQTVTGKPNASPPPGDPLVPGSPGFDKTADKLTGGTGDGTDPNADKNLLGMDNTTLLLLAGVAALVLMRK